MAPYVIAHFKISLKLYETEYNFESNQRARIYLTNALEPAKDTKQLPFQYALTALAKEGIEVDHIKRSTRFTVILGNPPYSGHSANKGDWIKKLLHGSSDEGKVENYFSIGGESLNEKNPKWLNDDYVKFIRLAHWQIERTGQGIVGLITNHGYLDNPTFRGMRESILSTFPIQNILDLHGNSKKKESSPDGSKDENVFDIQQGVAVGFFVKPVQLLSKISKHFHLWGMRELSNGFGKFEILESNNVGTLKWETVTPQHPNFFLVPYNYEFNLSYDLGWKFTDFIPVISVGIITARDNLTIQFSREEIDIVVKKISSLSEEEARKFYNLSKDSKDWQVALAQKDIRLNKGKFCPILYRPFDTRFTYYTGKSRGFICRPRPDVMCHLLSRTNVALIFSRQNIPPDPPVISVMVANTIVDGNAIHTSNGIANVAPLYILPEDNTIGTEDIQERDVNIKQEILEEITSLAQHPEFGSPDEFHIFDYIYGALQCPAYLNAYAVFLKEDFPRIPKPSSPNEFWHVSRKGGQLRKLHLLKDPILNNLPITLTGKGKGIVEHPRYQNGRISINQSQGFDGVPEDVWNCYVGGFQVAQKWLKSRKGRELTLNDIKHYQRILKILDETIRIRNSIIMDI